MQEPQPQLAELLRTCVCPPSLLLEIVHIEFLEVKREETSTKSSDGDPTSLSDETHRYAVKYVLSDGEIMMQALLHRKLTGLRDVADVVVGDLLDVRRFAVKKSSRADGHGRIVYLAIEDCHFLHRIRPPRQDFNEAQELQKVENSRKRKREVFYGDAAAKEGGASPDMQIADLAGQSIAPPAAKRPSLHQTSHLTATSSIAIPQFEMVKAQRPVPNTDNMISQHIFKSPTSGQAHTENKRDSGAMVSSKLASDKRDGNDILKSTFGARQIIFDEEEDDFFEALPSNQITIKQRRKALQKLDGNTSFNSQISSVPDNPDRHDDLVTPSKPPKLHPKSSPPEVTPSTVISDQLPPLPLFVPQKIVRDGTFALSQTPAFYLPQPPPVITTKPQAPARQVQTQPISPPVAQPALLPSPPFHTLSSLRNPHGSQSLPAKSYTLTTLAVISWTGTTTIHRPGSLFPPKRHLKIIDPSLATSRPPSRQINARQSVRDPNPSSFRAQNSFQDAVTVAVYIDAANFKPAAGTLVLFRGLVMQRLVNGDIILNAYGRLKEQRFEETSDKIEEGKEETANQEQAAGDPTSGDANSNDHWFITDHSKIRKLGYGSRLDYYLDWWVEKQRAQQLQPIQN